MYNFQILFCNLGPCYRSYTIYVACKCSYHYSVAAVAAEIGELFGHWSDSSSAALYIGV